VRHCWRSLRSVEGSWRAQRLDADEGNFVGVVTTGKARRSGRAWAV